MQSLKQQILAKNGAEQLTPVPLHPLSLHQPPLLQRPPAQVQPRVALAQENAGLHSVGSYHPQQSLSAGTRGALAQLQGKKRHQHASPQVASQVHQCRLPEGPGGEVPGAQRQLILIYFILFHIIRKIIMPGASQQTFSTRITCKFWSSAFWQFFDVFPWFSSVLAP